MSRFHISTSLEELLLIKRACVKAGDVEALAWCARSLALFKEQNGKSARRYRVAAKRLLERDGELEVDGDALVSFGDDPGAYVMAWVWVKRSQIGRKR